MPKKEQIEIEGRTLALSNLDKVLYSGDSFTKAHVIDYYARVAPWLLPHFHNRPVTLKRLPDGVTGKVFYEKDAPRYTPDWVHIAPVPRRYGGDDIRYIVIDDLPTLIWCANIASLELHPFLHRSDHINQPDSMVFDLDPGEGATAATCADVAFLLKAKLQTAGMQSFPKMSGSKGIQVYVPLNSGASYEVTQTFAKEMAQALEKEHPDLVLSEMAKKLRHGKVFVDWSQNSDFKTTVGVYSLRAKADRPYVSMPVTWDELGQMRRKRDPNMFCFEPAAALERLARTGDLFAPVLTLRQQLPSELPRFVMQKHAAKQLHYDFRLAINGALRSWAVPKGFPYSLDEKRLAMQVEDHPLDYIGFEGTIPANQYGGGTVMVWDAGTYRIIEGNPHGGKLRLALNGTKLKGEWLMVRGRDPKQWFVSKADRAMRALSAKREDLSAASARTMAQIAATNDAQWHSNRSEIEGLDLDSLPQSTLAFVEPMQPKLADALPEGDDWIYEVKLDGYRALAIRKGNAADLLSRRGNNMNDRFPNVCAALQQVEDGVILDGEITALDQEGRPSFSLLQNHKGAGAPVVYYAFDILAYRGRSLTGLKLSRRREILESVLKNVQEPLRLSVVLQASPEHLIAAAREQKLEGLVAKRSASVYEPGQRTGAWVKLKINQGQELVIAGYKPGKQGFENLAVGYYEDGKLLFIGKLKNGFVPEIRRQVAEHFAELETDVCPFANLPEPKNARRGEALTADAMKKYRWLKPSLVTQVEYTEWTEANHLRHSRFIALRDDKDPLDVVQERLSA